MISRHIKEYADFWDSNSMPVGIMDHLLKVEICKNPAEGLIGRDIKYDGMIFKFENAKPLSFHTKGCIVPIDIVFILNDEIVKIEEYCEPNTPNNFECGKADTVLEFPAGTCKNLGISVGIFCNI